MIKFYNLLFEGVMSPLLYHITSASRAASILQENKFRLTPAYGTDADMSKQKDKLYFLSTSRIKYGGYSRSLADTGNVNFELDGRKLNQNYTSVNVDYWGRDWRVQAWEQGNYMRFLRHDENEERIITDEPEIESAAKYIKSIHVSVGDPEELRNNEKKSIKQLERLAKKRGVNVYFYINPEDWKLHNEKKAYKSTENIFTYQVDSEDENERRVYMKNIEGFINLFSVDNPDQLDDNGENIYNSLRYGSWTKDLIKQTKNEIHNNKSNPKGLDKIKKLSAVMKRRGVANIKGLIEVASERAQKLAKIDKKSMYEDYKRLVEAILDIYSIKNSYDISKLNQKGNMDAVTRYFRFERRMEDWRNKDKERAYKTLNDLRDLINHGYFSELESAMKSEGKKTLRDFMMEVIEPIMDKAAENEGWDWWKQPKKSKYV